VRDPVLCVSRSRTILLAYEEHERETFRTYTWLAWSAVVPGLIAFVLVALQLAGRRGARKDPPA